MCDLSETPEEVELDRDVQRDNYLNADARLREALGVLDHLQGVLHTKIDGRPAHPWVPGAAFGDGELMGALVEARTFLVGNGVTPGGNPPRRHGCGCHYPDGRNRWETPDRRVIHKCGKAPAE